MPPTGDFKAQLGRPENPGLLNPAARLALIQPGRNPYVTGTSLPGNSPVFFGRAQALHEILATLRRSDKPGCVSLLGERRIGKSSLLNQVWEGLAKEPGLVSIHATAQNWNQSSQAHFYGRLQRVVNNAIGQAAQEEVSDYPGFRDFIDTLSQQHGYRFVLILDEFEVMTGNPSFDADFFSNMRALGERPEYRFGYLVSSRRPLKELCRDHKIEASSFWNIFGQRCVLGLLSEHEAQDLVVEPMRRSLPPASQPDLKPLWKNNIAPLTGCHPALIQIVASTHWNALEGAYSLDPMSVVMNVRDHLEDLWYRRGKEELSVLIRAAAGRRPDHGPLVTNLIQRGLLTLDRKPFSSGFVGVIKECIPQGKSLTRQS